MDQNTQTATTEIAFGNVLFKQNILQVGGSSYRPDSVSAFHVWEDLSAARNLRKHRTLMLSFAFITIVCYFSWQWSMTNINSPSSILGLFGILLFYPMAVCTLVCTGFFLRHFFKNRAGDASGANKNNTRLTVSFIDGSSCIISGKAEDLHALQSAMQKAMTSR
jgi:hypothetical protein